MSTMLKRDREIKRRYEEGESTGSIGKDFGMTSRNVRRILNQVGVELKSRGRPTRYKIDEDFFKRWSPDMAYVLGLVITDGTINGNQVVLAQKERQILEKVVRAMGSDYPVRERSNGEGNIYTLTISRKTIVEDLRKLGVDERKSLIIRMPKIPEQYLGHFLRGVIDGDGWVHEKGYTMCVTTGSQTFAEELEGLFSANGYRTRATEQQTVNTVAYRAWVSGKGDIKRLGRWLYEDCGELYIPRKRERFEYHLDVA